MGRWGSDRKGRVGGSVGSAQEMLGSIGWSRGVSRGVEVWGVGVCAYDVTMWWRDGEWSGCEDEELIRPGDLIVAVMGLDGRCRACHDGGAMM